MTWAEKIIQFLHHLELDQSVLPENIQPLYPLKGENSLITEGIISYFYKRFYSDDRPRRFVIGINPGRLGAGATGIPFSDTKRLKQFCDIEVTAFHTHEPSSVFIYDMIEAYGGAELFYSNFYITSVCPIGFVEQKDTGKWLNYNYYDSKSLTESIEPYIIEKMKKQIEFGADTSVAFCLGTGKNFKYFNALNKRLGLFGAVVPLEHPRYVMQYKNKSKDLYINKYLSVFSGK